MDQPVWPTQLFISPGSVNGTHLPTPEVSLHVVQAGYVCLPREVQKPCVDSYKD